MASTILAVGATGNTGRGVVQTLSGLLGTSKTFSGHKIVALTRSSRGAVAQQLAALPNVEVAELNWVDITADWLHQHNVVGASMDIAAAERLFVLLPCPPLVDLVKEFRKTGKQGPLRLIASENAPVGIIDASEVGIFAAHLLVEDNIIAMLEQEIGTKVEDVRFRDQSFLDHMAAQSRETKSVILSIRHAAETAWDGKCSASTTSKEVIHLAAPKIAPAKVFKTMLEE
ncbi:related to NmrA-like family protein [Fusarium oxysporum]|uniref:Related to NmrA-like family protein n=1 Tax=Fusarium oxysporum TaxID=5507 RepID=A0A2H3U352_FUSOX|nr:related to NmrA-like family protein [Fusarium oxysporum]